MKERFLLMSTPMVKALLAKIKTMTRRIGDRYKTWQKGDRIWVKETYQEGLAIGGCIGEPGENNTIDVIYKADNESCDKWSPSIFMPKKLARIWLEMIVDVREERLQDITEEDCLREGILKKETSLGIAYYLQEADYNNWSSLTMELFRTAKECYRNLWNNLNAKPKPIYLMNFEGTKREIVGYESYPWDISDADERESIKGKPHYIHANPIVNVIEFKEINK